MTKNRPLVAGVDVGGTNIEVRQAARWSGHASLEDVAAVVLETDGNVSVLPAVPDLTPERS